MDHLSEQGRAALVTRRHRGFRSVAFTAPWVRVVPGRVEAKVAS